MRLCGELTYESVQCENKFNFVGNNLGDYCDYVNVLMQTRDTHSSSKAYFIDVSIADLITSVMIE